MSQGGQTGGIRNLFHRRQPAQVAPQSAPTGAPPPLPDRYGAPNPQQAAHQQQLNPQGRYQHFAGNFGRPPSAQGAAPQRPPQANFYSRPNTNMSATSLPTAGEHIMPAGQSMGGAGPASLSESLPPQYQGRPMDEIIPEQHWVKSQDVRVPVYSPPPAPPALPPRSNFRPSSPEQGAHPGYGLPPMPNHAQAAPPNYGLPPPSMSRPSSQASSRPSSPEQGAHPGFGLPPMPNHAQAAPPNYGLPPPSMSRPSSQASS
ncbi:MAG: hypothetical protein ABW123_14240, partial [Cystobacter sp.]